MKIKRLFFSLLTLVLFMLPACACFAGAKAPVPVRVVRAEASGPGEVRHYYGAVQGSRRVNLSFRVPGPLVEFPVEMGARVKKGQLLGRIDPRDYRTRLAEARSQMSQASARHSQALSNFRRYEELYRKQAISQAQYDQFRTALDVARSALRTAEAGVSAAQNALADTELRAPFAGVIVARLVENYQDVQAKQPVVSLQNLENVEIVVRVPEEDIANLAVTQSGMSAQKVSAAVGLALRVTIDALPGREFTASFKEIGTQSDPRTHTYPGTVVMPQPENARILPGMTVLVTATLPAQTPTAENGFAVPLEALCGNVRGEKYVWKCLEGGAVQKIPVNAGEFRGAAILVSGALSLGDLIVGEGARNLNEDSLVRVIE
ncbi:MAG: efflux RND transporter periplasmic adaptor subunit [Pyramidobacter sp.]|nr:efflux RND transporter periplasmic adaptor subunit [Pyramidobacter sp.]